MKWSSLKIFIPRKFLGIDIGTSSIKIVELSRWGERRKLENYGEIKATVLYDKPFRTFEKSTLTLLTDDISRAILAVKEEAKIKTQEAVFSIPDFSSFFTNFELPPLSKEELPQAVKYAAHQHVPLPLGEVTFDWQVIEGRVSDQKNTKLKVLLVAVPNEVINQYRRIAELSKLQLHALEAEVFGLVRSLIGGEKSFAALVDIGAQSTTCSIIEKGILKISHSFDLSGNEFTERIAKSLSIDYKSAEDLKNKFGIQALSLPGATVSQPLSIRDILLPLIDLILREIEKVFREESSGGGKEIKKIILAGASASLPGLKEYFQNYFNPAPEKIQYGTKIEVEIASPFSNIFYPPILEKKLKEMGPAYAIAVGMALRGLE